MRSRSEADTYPSTRAAASRSSGVNDRARSSGSSPTAFARRFTISATALSDSLPGCTRWMRSSVLPGWAVRRKVVDALETLVPVLRPVEGSVRSRPVLGGLHYVYERAA